MKLLQLLLVFTPSLLFSQITLTDTDFASAGDTVRMSRATDNSIDFLSTGANQTWDFSYLTFNNQIRRDFEPAAGLPLLINIVFGSFASNNYKASYYLPSTDLPIDQFGNFLPITISDMVQYSKKTSDSITSIGYSLEISGNGIPVKSDTIETRYKFPLNYGDTYNSRGYTKLDMNPIYDAVWLQYRQRMTEVDGWGSVTTPYGTFDALRVKHIITEKDSLRVDLFGNLTWIPLNLPKSYIYEWITKGEQDAVLRIATSEVGGNEIVTSIEYRDENLTAQLTELEINFDVYPNPASEFITVSNVLDNGSFYIIDNKGSFVLEGELNGEINISSLLSGNYELIIHSGNQIGKKSFIKQD